jgi:hypothetical protein
MKCKHVQELLPLYIGGDLEGKRQRLITAHVESCAVCAGSVNEYRETKRLMEHYAPPPFSEAVYTGVRQQVLREIERDSPAPPLTQLVASWFRPRITWALATALLLAVSVLALYFIADRKNDRQQLANVPGSVDGVKQDEPPNVRSQKDYLGRPVRRDASRGAVTPPMLARSSARTRLSLIPKKVRRSSLAGTSPANSSADPADLFLGTPIISEKTLRVEMQTRDPNIRIIWFVTEKTKRDSPSEPSKGI